MELFRRGSLVWVVRAHCGRLPSVRRRCAFQSPGHWPIQREARPRETERERALLFYFTTPRIFLRFPAQKSLIPAAVRRNGAGVDARGIFLVAPTGTTVGTRHLVFFLGLFHLPYRLSAREGYLEKIAYIARVFFLFGDNGFLSFLIAAGGTCRTVR